MTKEWFIRFVCMIAILIIMNIAHYFWDWDTILVPAVALALSQHMIIEIKK